MHCPQHRGPGAKWSSSSTCGGGALTLLAYVPQTRTPDRNAECGFVSLPSLPPAPLSSGWNCDMSLCVAHTQALRPLAPHGPTVSVDGSWFQSAQVSKYRLQSAPWLLVSPRIPSDTQGGL